MAKKVRTGDIIEIETKGGYHYALFTHHHAQMGALLRVFRGSFAARPEDLQSVLHSEVQFSVFFPLQAAVNRELVSVAGNVPVPPELADFPVFRNGIANPDTGKVSVWWLWDGQKEWKIGELSSDQKGFPLRQVWTDVLLKERIESGWTHSDDSRI